MAESAGLRYKPDPTWFLRLGLDEQRWQQSEANRDARQRILGQLVKPGLIIDYRPDGGLGTEWLPEEDPANPGYLIIGDDYTDSFDGVQALVDAEGYVVAAEGNITPSSRAHRPYTATPPLSIYLTVPADSVWRTLVVRRRLAYREPGLISFNGGNVVTLAGGSFYDYAARVEGGAHGTYLRIDATDNAVLGAFVAAGSSLEPGVYEIDSIVSATEARLTENAPAVVAGLPFQVTGSFRQGAGVPANPDIHQFLEPEFELVARTREPSNNDLILADVRRLPAGAVEIIDRRVMSLARFRSSVRSTCYLKPYSVPSTTAPFLAMELNQITLANDVTGQLLLPDATTVRYSNGKNGLIAVYRDQTAGFIRSQTFRFSDGNIAWNAPVNIVADVNVLGQTILHVPNASGWVHLCCYDRSGTIYYKTSTDNGNTWSAEVLLWATAVPADAVLWPKAIILLSHKIMVLAEYHDNATNIGTIRCAYSDDYGATWDTNAGAGHTLISVVGAIAGDKVSMPEVGQDGVTGAVWITCYGTKAGTTGIYVTRTTDKTGLTGYTNFNTTLPGFRGLNTGLGETTVAWPACWVSDDGMCHVVAHLFRDDVAGAGGYLDLQYVRFEYTAANTIQKVSDRRFLRAENSANAIAGNVNEPVYGMGPSLTQTPDGTVHLVYLDPEESVGDTAVKYLMVEPQTFITSRVGFNG